MEIACYGNPSGFEVTPEEFVELATAKYKEKGIFPYCSACSEIVEVYGVHSPNVDSRFDHKDLSEGADPLDDCVLANRNSRLKGLRPDSWDRERGVHLRRQFFEDDNLRTAYAFCLHLCREGNLPTKKFQTMIHRADKKNIWSYADIPLWVVPYIILTLENFVGERKGGGKYDFHFVFSKPKGSSASALWERSPECTLKKLFSNSGEVVSAYDNPYLLSEDAFIEKAGDSSWITADLLQRLRV